MPSLAQGVYMFKGMRRRETGIFISMTGATLPAYQLFDASGRFPQPVLGWTFQDLLQWLLFSLLQHSSVFWSTLCFFVYFTTCSLALFIVLVGVGAHLDQRECFFSLLKWQRCDLFSEISHLINSFVQTVKMWFPFLLYPVYKHMYPLIWLFYF